MADEIIKNMKVKLNDDGTIKKTTKSVKDLNKNLDGTTASAKRADKQIKQLNKTAAGGTAASRKAAQTAESANKAQHQQFDRARGVSAASGAAARDFANQSRGLGGLVRLYATFAANLFALGAAFRALSGSMDTSNMVKGLDQLGAAVGRNLGGLSKELVEISGGAISLAQAMKAVAQTSTGGLSGENIKRLGGVARTAAAALGVAMPDAVNRLSRAITKLEPELLDELGIMTRLEPAVDIYARQLGKASSQLTQFERRQAFANAVLAEGEEKFGAIEDIPINAFDVLASSLKDLTQILGEFLNKALVPVIQLLSSSPIALGAGMLALVGIIGKQAIPVFLDLNKQFAVTAAKATEAAEARSAAAQKTQATLRKLDVQRLSELQVTANKEIDIQAKLLAKITAMNAAAQAKRPVPSAIATARQSIITSVAGKSSEDLRKADVRAIQAQADALNRGTGASRAMSVEVDKLAKSLGREIAATRTASAEVIKRTRSIGNNTAALAANKAALEAGFIATRKQIIADTAANTTLVGRTAALQIAAAETAKLNAAMAATTVTTSRFAKAMFGARVALASLATQMAFVSAAVNKLFSAFAAIAILAVVFAFVKQAFSDNTKEVEKFNSAIDDAESSSDNMVRTLKLMSEKGLKGSIEGIIATANAFDGLATSMAAVVETAREAQEAASTFDNISDGFFSFFGGGIENNLNEQLSSLTLGAIKGLDETGLKEVGEAKFREILGITTLDSELNERTVTKAIGSLGKEGQDALKENLKEVGQELSNAASRMESFRTATVAANLAFAQLIQSTASNDPIFRLGVTMQGLAASMIKVATSGSLVTEQIDAIVLNLSQNSDSAILFGPATVANILEVKNEILALAEARKEITRIDKELSSATPGSLSEKSNELKTVTKDGIEIVLSDQFLTVFEQLSQQRADAVEITKTQEAITAKSAKVFSLALTESFERGSALISQATGQAQEKAALAIRKSNLGGLSGEQRAREQLAISKKEIQIQIQAVSTSINLITSQEALRATIESNTASNARASAIASGASPEEISGLTDALAAAKIFESAFNQEGGFTIKGFDKLIENIGEGIVKQLVQARGITPKSQIAGQDATRVVLEATRASVENKARREIAKGILEDEKRITAAQAAGIELQKKALQLAMDISGTKSVAAVKQQGILDLQLLEIKQTNQVATSQLAITNAASTGEENKQRELASQQLLNQEVEKGNLLTQITINNAEAVAAEFALDRDVRIAEAIQIQEQELGILDIARAQNDAAATRFGLTDSIRASLREQTDLAALALQTAQAEAIEQGKIAAIKLKASEIIETLDDTGGDSGAARAQLKRDERASAARLLTITTTAAQEARILAIRTKATKELDRQNRLLKTSSKLAVDLGKNFGKIGKGIGSLVTTFSKFMVNFEKGQGTITTLLKEREEIKAKEIVDNNALIEVEKNLQIARTESVINQLDGFSDLAGAGKSFFDEQSQGYKILSGIEKAFAVLSIALKVERVIADTSATVAEVANSQTRTSSTIVEAGVSGVAAVVKTLASLPFPANLAAGALIAGVVAALLSSIGGKGPKVNTAGFTAADVQDVQGTGTTFQNGQKVSRAGGALGADDEVVKDIGNSIDIIESNTRETNVFAADTLLTLNLIEQNTRELAVALIGSTNISKRSSGFGTQEGSKLKGLDILKVDTAVAKLAANIPIVGGVLSGIGNAVTGLLNKLFGTKTKIKIIDKGVLATGKLADILDGSNIFQEFETLKITKKSLFSKSSKIQQNTKDLESATAEEFVKLFDNLIDVAVSSAKVAFGEANNSIENALKTFQIDFKVSGLGLSGEEFAEAILAESTVIVNQLVGQALPVLEVFRELGEGFAGTLIRVATTMSVAKQSLERLGISVKQISGNVQAKKVDPKLIAEANNLLAILNEKVFLAARRSFGKSARANNEAFEAENRLADARIRIANQVGGIATELVQNLNAAQHAVTLANIRVAVNRKSEQGFDQVRQLEEGSIDAGTRGVRNDALALFEAKKALKQAGDAFFSVINNSGIFLIKFTTDFVKAFGGLEDFIAKTDFFFQNFFTEAEQKAAKVKELNSAIRDLGQKGFITAADVRTLTDGTGDLRQEFREIQLRLLNTAGASGVAANALIRLAPAVVAVSDEIQGLGENLDDLSALLAAISEDLMEGFSGILEDAITGDLDTDDIGNRVSSLINDTFALAMSESLVNDISSMLVNELITPILTGALTATTIANFSITAVIDDMMAKAELLVNVLNDPRIRTALATINIAATKVIKEVTNGLEGLNFVFSELRLDELTERIADLTQQINEQALDNLIDAEQTLLNTRQEQANNLRKSAGDFREFSDSLDDFRRSLLTSELSPLTPEEKLNTAEANFNRLVAESKDTSDPVAQAEALSRIEGAATDFLENARVFFSSSPAFTAIFDSVTSELNALSILTGDQATIDELQLAALELQITNSEAQLEILNEQRDALNNIDTNIEALTKELVDAESQLAAELAKANDQIVAGFNILDADFSGSLSLDELKNSGLASDATMESIQRSLDTNGDGQISALEAIVAATAGTEFGIQNLISILAAVNAGEITSGQGQTQIDALNIANQTTGGSAIDADFDSGGGEFDIASGGIVDSATRASVETATISGDTITGIEGTVLSLTEAKRIIDQAGSDIMNGITTARVVFDAFQAFGITSQQVAIIADNGTTAQGVNDFFQLWDPSLPSFAKGINNVPEDMVAQLHQGERVLPAADNTELMAAIANKSQANQEVVTEVRRLNAQMQLVETAITQNAVTQEVADMLGKMLEDNSANAQAIVEATMQAADEGADKVAESNGNLAAQEEWRKRSVVEIR